MKAIIQYFLKRPTVINAIMLGVLFAGVLAWNKIGKEEMPEFEMPSIRVTLKYPGASGQDVEFFLTKPIEEVLKGVTGLDEVISNASYGSTTITIVFEPGLADL